MAGFHYDATSRIAFATKIGIITMAYYVVFIIGHNELIETRNNDLSFRVISYISIIENGRMGNDVNLIMGVQQSNQALVPNARKLNLSDALRSKTI